MYSTDLPRLSYRLQAGQQLHADSRDLRAGDVFIACQGEYADGRRYIAQAAERGAAFVFWDDDGTFFWPADLSLPNQGIAGLRERAGVLAAELYGNRSGGLDCWGVTGTNGKTSVTQWLAQAADRLAGRPDCGIIGTVGNGFWGQLQAGSHTTPDAVSLQTLLHGFRSSGATRAAVEVSSHGLDQFRVNGVPFSAAVFTNLTRDHLDYHGDMAAYGAAKAKLFLQPDLKHALINIDDAYGMELAARLASERPTLNVLRYGFHPNADVRISRYAASAGGFQVALDTPWGGADIFCRLIGRFNAQNLAACFGLLCAEGYPPAAVASALVHTRPATGRMDCIPSEHGPLVVVDYAHTPDALEKALTTLAELRPQGGKIWCVFGCGGNRDRGKRPLMGAAAAAHSDCVVLTSDNPRMEEPEAILADILPAVPNPALVEADRRTAIETAIREADCRDIVLIAGKGHETYQDIGGVKRHFSDFEAAQQALADRN